MRYRSEKTDRIWLRYEHVQKVEKSEKHQTITSHKYILPRLSVQDAPGSCRAAFEKSRSVFATVFLFHAQHLAHVVRYYDGVRNPKLGLSLCSKDGL